MITADQLTGGIIGALLGAIAVFGALYKYISRTLTPSEAKEIYDKAKAAIDEYNTAIADGAITTEEKLKIAEKTLSTLQTVIEALES
ncbi:MAG: hypothetical protein ABIJ04_03650 [Bacteroidota bacterium]|uniref:Holin n=1 Tax=viral metagenome TaxID=1070528 RepID=A0A6M3LZC8_9ZZZZ